MSTIRFLFFLVCGLFFSSFGAMAADSLHHHLPYWNWQFYTGMKKLYYPKSEFVVEQGVKTNLQGYPTRALSPLVGINASKGKNSFGLSFDYGYMPKASDWPLGDSVFTVISNQEVYVHNAITVEYALIYLGLSPSYYRQFSFDKTTIRLGAAAHIRWHTGEGENYSMLYRQAPDGSLDIRYFEAQRTDEKKISFLSGPEVQIGQLIGKHLFFSMNVSYSFQLRSAIDSYYLFHPQKSFASSGRLVIPERNFALAFSLAYQIKFSRKL